MSKVIDVVSWTMKDDEDIFLKLEKTGKTYDISEAVVKFLDSKDLFGKLDDKTVEVEIDETKGDNGTITMLKLSDGTAEPAKDEPKPYVANGLVVKTVTIGGVSVPKESAVDKATDTWYVLDSTINAQQFKTECTGKEVEITSAPQEKGNDVIKSYNLKTEEKKEDPKETAKKTYKGNGNSIEAQASLKCAKQIVSSMVDKDSKADDVLLMITKIAKHSYKLIQELKNGE